MNSRSLSLVLGLFVSAADVAIARAEGSGGPPTIEAASHVAAVTVFRDRARVTREATLDLQPGAHRVRFGRLPMVLDPDSARIAGHGDARVVIQSLELRQEEEKPPEDPELDVVQEELRRLGRDQALAEARGAALDFLHGVLESWAGSASKATSSDPPTRLDIGDWARAWQFLSERLDGIATEKQNVAEAIEAAQREIVLRRGRIDSTASTRRQTVWVADALLSVAQRTQATLSLTYLSPDAAWEPSYDARLSPTASKLTLAAFARLHQATGEDWTNVQVTLSSTQPLAGLDLPRLTTLYLRPLVPSNIAAAKLIDGLSILGRNYQDALTPAPGVGLGDVVTLHGARDTNVAGGFVATQPKAIPAALAPAEVEARSAGVVYHLPEPVSIPSDGQSHRHLIFDREVRTEVDYRAVPALLRSVYVVARATLPSDLTLLPGPMQHFIDEDLVGRSSLPATTGGSPLLLGFGPEERLVVERHEEETSGTRAGKENETRRSWVTTLKNRLDRPVSVEIAERMPVAADDRIRVLLDKDDTTSGYREDDKERGVLRWTVMLGPGAERDTVLRFRVRAPQDLAVEYALASR
jgi:uncharacterized protein (TIGR02231 family)